MRNSKKKRKQRDDRRMGGNLERRSSSKNMRRDEEIEDTSKREFESDRRQFAKRSTPNDPSWYAHNPQLMLDFGSLSFGNPTGAPFVKNGSAVTVPGIMAIYFDPQIGVAQAENDPINIAMRSFYAYIRSGQSGSKNYDPPDLMMYVLALDSAYMYLEWMKRMYGAMATTSPFNRYFGKALVLAMGGNFDDLAANFSDFRGFINLYAAKLANLVLPAELSYSKRHAWMTSGLFLDADNAKAQMYLYVPRSYYMFALDSQGAGSLNRLNVLGGGYEGQQSAALTLTDIIKSGMDLLDPMIVNQDFNLMSGDILRKVDMSGIMLPTGIADGYSVMPIYSQEVMSQIENLTIHGVSSNTVAQKTDVGTGYLYLPAQKFEINPPLLLDSAATIDAAVFAQYMSSFADSELALLNYHMLSPTVGDVMVGTRLTSIPKSWSATISGSNKAMKLQPQYDSFGSETISHIRTFTLTNSQNAYMTFERFNTTFDLLWLSASNSTSEEASAVNSYLRKLTNLAAFDWHPQVYAGVGVFPNAGTSINMQFERLPVTDLDSYTTVDRNVLRHLHEVALLSEFTFPGVSTLGR